ncbi:MAG: PadR family transcriptional regulator [Symbiobacteriia bacterium]
MDGTNDWISQLRRGVLELCILALIEQAPRYGYEIVTGFAVVPTLAAGEGTIYPLLRRLKQAGRLETYWQESEAGPPRQYYKLSAGGEAALAAMRREWQELTGAVDFLIRTARRVLED